MLTGVVAAVERAAADAGARVSAVALRVGSLSDTVPEALEGSWPIATHGTPLAGAALVVEQVQAAVWCPACAAQQPVDEFFALVCPVCGTPTGHLAQGREFEIAWVEWDVPGQPSHSSST